MSDPSPVREPVDDRAVLHDKLHQLLTTMANASGILTETLLPDRVVDDTAHVLRHYLNDVEAILDQLIDEETSHV